MSGDVAASTSSTRPTGASRPGRAEQTAGNANARHLLLSALSPVHSWSAAQARSAAQALTKSQACHIHAFDLAGGRRYDLGMLELPKLLVGTLGAATFRATNILAGGSRGVCARTAILLALMISPALAEPAKPPAQSEVPGARKPPPGPRQSTKPPLKPDGSTPGAEAHTEADRTSLPHPSTIKTAAQKRKVLADLYERLVAADSVESAEVVADTIEQLWLHSGSDTTNLLMEHALEALHDKKPELALQMLDGVVKLQPGFVEAWNRRAYVHFAQKDYAKALLDLRRVLALEPRHFKAINGLATILREFGEKRGALRVYRMLLEVHPFAEDARQAVKELEREVEGENL